MVNIWLICGQYMVDDDDDDDDDDDHDKDDTKMIQN